MTKRLTLVFDLDGTLVDTAPDLTAAMNHVLERAGRPPVPPLEVRHMVGRGAAKLIERGFASTGAPAHPDELKAHVEAFLAYYGANVAVRSAPFDDCRETVAQLKHEGHFLGVCTNKPENLSLALLEALDMRRFFGAVLGADTLPVRKPDPQHLLETIARLGGKRTEAVMIGDSEVDAETAKAAGVPFVCFSFGYSTVPPEELAADALIHHYRELPGALAQISARLTG